MTGFAIELSCGLHYLQTLLPNVETLFRLNLCVPSSKLIVLLTSVFPASWCSPPSLGKVHIPLMPTRVEAKKEVGGERLLVVYHDRPNETGCSDDHRISCLYAVTVTSKSPSDNVGSTVKIPKRSYVQNLTRSSSC